MIEEDRGRKYAVGNSRIALKLPENTLKSRHPATIEEAAKEGKF